MATISIEALISRLLDDCGLTETNNPGVHNSAQGNILAEIPTPLQQASIIARLEASMKSRHQAFYASNPILLSANSNVALKDIPKRDEQECTEDRRLLREQMADSRLGGLARDECQELTAIFKAKPMIIDTKATAWNEYKDVCRGRKIMADARMRAIERINVSNTEESGPSGSERSSNDAVQETNRLQDISINTQPSVKSELREASDSTEQNAIVKRKHNSEDDVEDQVKRPRSQAVIKKRLSKKWLASEEGLAWQATRDAAAEAPEGKRQHDAIQAQLEYEYQCEEGNRRHAEIRTLIEAARTATLAASDPSRRHSLLKPACHPQ